MTRYSFESQQKNAYLAVIVVLQLALGTSAAVAQSQDQHSRVKAPVTVALVEKLPAAQSSYAAVIIRPAGGNEVILMPRKKASAELLDAATRTLLHARSIYGIGSNKRDGQSLPDMILGLHLSPPPVSWAAENSSGIERAFERLTRAKSQAVDGVGLVPAITFFPPAPPRRSRRD